MPGDSTPGLCGRFTTPKMRCRVAHVNGSSPVRYANEVGSYPSDCLPSRTTVWHSVWNTSVPFAAPLDPGFGGTPFGEMLAGFLLIAGGGQAKRWDSWHTVIFAATSNRLNIPYVLKQSDIDAAATWEKTHPEERKVTIDLGEYAFQVVGVCDTPYALLFTGTPNELTPDDLAQIAQSGEAASDRAFRKLWETPLDPQMVNRYVEIERNDRAWAYRLDNADGKCFQAWSQTQGGLKNTSIRDASSRRVVVDLKLPYQAWIKNSQGGLEKDGVERPAKAGDVLWVSYVAVKKHYIRQKVTVTWLFIEAFPQGAYCYPIKVQVANYRFFEWQTDGVGYSKGVQTNQMQGADRTLLAGWRCTDACNLTVNHVALFGFFFDNPELGDIGVGYAPTLGQEYFKGNATLQLIDQYLGINGQTREDRPTYDMVSDSKLDIGIKYHVNKGKKGDDNTAYRQAQWYRDQRWTAYFQDDRKSIQHVFYNMSPPALKKRDIDKWAIEKTLAQSLQDAIKGGKPTFFPFMDDPAVDNPTSGTNEYLNSGNCVFNPIMPTTPYTISNAEADAGNIGTFGFFGGNAFMGGPGGFSDGLQNYHAFNSNIIEEVFDKDTRVLVEQNFSSWEMGPVILTIQCQAGELGQSITCLADNFKSLGLVSHTNSDSFAVMNQFDQSTINMSELNYRPDLPANSKEATNPSPELYTSELGYTSNLGDAPGYQPGRVIALDTNLPADAHVYYYYNLSPTESPLSDVSAASRMKIEPTIDNDLGLLKIQIPGVDVYHRSISIQFSGSISEDISDNVLVMLKGGNGGIDQLRLYPFPDPTLQIFPQYMKATEIDIAGPALRHLSVKSVLIKTLRQNKAENYLLNVQREQDGIDWAQILSGKFTGASIASRTTMQPIFLKATTVTLSVDARGNLYEFLSDSNDGISAVMSPDNGNSWYFFFGIVEPIYSNPAFDPLVVNDHENDRCFLFFRMQNKLFCKEIPFKLFNLEDAGLVERSDADIYVTNDKGEVVEEKKSVYSPEGVTLRRRQPAYIAGGLINSLKTRMLLGISDDQGHKINTENNARKDEATGNTINVPRNYAALGSGTLLPNMDFQTGYYSATRSRDGKMRVWFLSDIKADRGDDASGGGGSQLQCYVSVDDGVAWQDQWECIHYGDSRAKYDDAAGMSYLALPGISSLPDGAMPVEFGINVHWSRLKQHKVDNASWESWKQDAESRVLAIDAPYAYYHSSTNTIFLFYIYQGVLLCKRIDEQLFDTSLRRGNMPNRDTGGNPWEGNGMWSVKNRIERGTYAEFVDGWLDQASLICEIGYEGTDTEILNNTDVSLSLKDNVVYANGQSTKVRNIIFQNHNAVKSFGQDRTIPPQRICAMDLAEGGLRVFYKFSDDWLRSALWIDGFWYVEDFLKPAEKA